MRDAAASPSTRRTTSARAGVCATVLLASLLLTSCGASSPPDAAPPPASDEDRTPTATPEPTPTPEPVTIPTSCEEIYSGELVAALSSKHAPLNDASMADPNYSNTDGVEELLRTLDPLRCTWGVAGPVGIVTGVAAVTAEQSTTVLEMLTSSAFACGDESGGTRCEFRSEGEKEFLLGESHFLRDGIWVSTFWINADITGYTEDIIATMWA